MAARRVLMMNTNVLRQSSAGSFRRCASTKASSEQTIFQTLYKTAFRSNASYVTYVVVGAIAFEAVYGTVTDIIWEQANRGRLYHHIDWAKFKTDEDEDEEAEAEAAEVNEEENEDE